MLRHEKFARKYGKRWGGNLALEGTLSAKEIIKDEEILKIFRAEDLVTLTGYIEYSRAKQNKTGKEGETIRTSYVSGLAVNDGQLFAITKDAVYRLHGPWVSDQIAASPVLSYFWERIKYQVLAQASKKA